MYLGPILAGHVAHFHKAIVYVEEHMLANNKYNLPLSPCLKINTYHIRRPSSEGDYGLILDLPNLSLSYHIMKYSPNLLILYDYSRVTWLGAFTARLLPHCRLLLLVETHPRFRGFNHQGIQLKIRKLIARQADAILTNNRHGEDYVTQTLGADPARVIARPYLTSQPGNVRSLADHPRMQQVNSGPLEFLFLNSITHRKGVEFLVRAVAALDPERRQAMHLRIVGDGPQREEVEKLAGELDLGETIEFVGRVPYSEIATYYNSADVYVGSTLRDYRSLTGFEALSFGMPVLMSCHDGAADEVVEEGRNGVIVDPRNTDAFASKFAWFIDNRHRLPEMRQASIEINQRFTVDSVVNNLIYASEQALTRR